MDRVSLIAAVQRVLDETEREYGQMPFFVRPLVKRGFVKRTGRDFDAWRSLLVAAARGQIEPALRGALDQLAEHYRGAPERAKRGMGGTKSQLATVEQRSRERAETALALRAALS